ncbi:hypothetical protein [Ketobacter sp.]
MARIIRAVAITIFIFMAFASPVLWDIAKLEWHESNPIEFDRVIWLEVDRTVRPESPVRLKMAADLIKKGSLIGLDESKVNELLGIPDEKSTIPGSVYWLASFGLDSAWLQVLYLDKVVSSTRIFTD